MPRLTDYNLNVLQIHIEKININSDFLLIYCGITDYLDKEIKSKVNFKKLEDKKLEDKKLSILLDTNGGTPDTLKKTVDFLRSIYDNIDFYIMDKAMSAGTMFCLSGNNIYMADQACLGPIDPQVIIGEKYVPAQAHLNAWENLRNKKENLSQAEIIMAQTFNPAELEFCKQASDFSIKLVQEWLIKYKFKNWNVNKEKKTQRAKEIAKKLDNSKEWKLHSYPLNKKELKDLGLKIEDISGELFKLINELDSIVKDILSLYKLNDFIYFKENNNEKNNKK